MEQATTQYKPVLRLIGNDKTALIIAEKARRTLVRAGLYHEADQFIQEATATNYHHLLETILKYCEVE